MNGIERKFHEAIAPLNAALIDLDLHFLGAKISSPTGDKGAKLINFLYLCKSSGVKIEFSITSYDGTYISTSIFTESKCLNLNLYLQRHNRLEEKMKLFNAPDLGSALQIVTSILKSDLREIILNGHLEDLPFDRLDY